jgi:hypothetical protein
LSSQELRRPGGAADRGKKCRSEGSHGERDAGRAEPALGPECNGTSAHRSEPPLPMERPRPGVRPWSHRRRPRPAAPPPFGVGPKRASFGGTSTLLDRADSPRGLARVDTEPPPRRSERKGTPPPGVATQRRTPSPWGRRLASGAPAARRLLWATLRMLTGTETCAQLSAFHGPASQDALLRGVSSWCAHGALKDELV